MNNNPIITIPQGKLRGDVRQDCNGKTYESFQGIPYAKPPLGKLRFKPPELPEKWLGIRDATQEGSECYSKNFVTRSIVGSEDCLFLNVYTSKTHRKRLLPVMFWIHGGAFTTGSGGTDLYGPEYLVAEDVVLVTINYRLGPLGFLAFSDPSVGVTGNAGLKDMVMALKWVQNNIKYFSGDPKNVTIFGESAGGAAVHFLILSPMAKGLFHKAIMQSACALNCFTRSRCSFTHELAIKLGIESNNDKFILTELQKIPIDKLFEASQKINDPVLISHMRPFCPVIEPKVKGAFLTEEPLSIIKSGKYNKVPIIMGYNSMEGIFVYTLLKASKTDFLHDGNFVPYTMNLRIGSEPYKKVVQEVRQFYGLSGLTTIKNDNDIGKLLKLYTHIFFMFEVCRSAKLHCKNNKLPLYFYRFNMDTNLNLLKMLTDVKVKGAAHADDLFYLFGNPVSPFPETGSVEYKAIKKMTRLWSNFAKFGNPTPHIEELLETTWEPVTNKYFNYLSMENSGFRMRANPEEEVLKFWEHLFDKYQILLSKL